jgi:hypothetical protein
MATLLQRNGQSLGPRWGDVKRSQLKVEILDERVYARQLCKPGDPGVIHWMFTFKHLRRRVFIAHSHGRLHVRILRERRTVDAIFGLMFSTVFFVLMGSVFIAPMRRAGWSTDLLYWLPFPVLLAVAYCIVLRIVIWNSFGREEIVVEGGELRWTCTAWWFNDKLKAAANEVAEVKAVTPWHGKCRIELTTAGHTYRVGDSMLRDEAIKLAHALKAALGLR